MIYEYNRSKDHLINSIISMVVVSIRTKMKISSYYCTTVHHLFNSLPLDHNLKITANNDRIKLYLSKILMILKYIKSLNYKEYDKIAGGITIDEIILKLNSILDVSKSFLCS
jgi:hypothetical protein